MNGAFAPGRRNRRVILQTPPTGTDAVGQPIATWTNVATVWASLSTVSSKEVYKAGQFTSQITHVVSILWSASLTLAAGMRVAYGSRTFQVQAVENVKEANRELNLMCVEINGTVV